MERKQYRTIPYLAHRYDTADDRSLYSVSDYFNDDIIGTLERGDVAVTPVRTADQDKRYNVSRYPTTMYTTAKHNQARQDNRIVYQRHNKGIPMLQICDVKLRYGSEEHVKYGWKLDEVTEEECKLEINQSDKNEQGKKTVKFCFATNDTDKLMTHIADGHEVKYIVRTDAIRLRLDLEIVLSPGDPEVDFKCINGEVKLEMESNDNCYTIHILQDQRPAKKPKLDHSSSSFELSIIRNVPRNLLPCMKLAVRLKDSSGTLDVDAYRGIFSYNIPVDQEDYFHFKKGYLKVNVFWGCSFNDGKGLCTGVCTCEPAEFIGFCSPDEVICSKDTEE